MNASNGQARLDGVRIDDADAGATLYVHVTPGAKRDAIKGAHGDRLKIAVAAPPEGGRANKRLVELLATTVRTQRSCVTIVSGSSSRQKRVVVEGLDAAGLRAALEKALTNG